MKSIVAARSLVIRCAFLLAAIGACRCRLARRTVSAAISARSFRWCLTSAGRRRPLASDFTIGFPTGITVKMNDRWAFDLEFVPAIQERCRCWPR